MPAGGYQRPSNPAPVSNPGSGSRRTDGRQPRQLLTDAAYGEQATFQADQAGAPMAATPGAGGAGGGAGGPVDLSNVVGFGADTQRPDEPVTHGADAGAGPGLASLGLSDDDDPGPAYLRRNLPYFEIAASMPNAGFGFRQFVRRLRGLA
jgi:hypothetical protein